VGYECSRFNASGSANLHVPAPRAAAAVGDAIVGVLNSSTFEASRGYFVAESGYVEGRNASFEYGIAEEHYDRVLGSFSKSVSHRCMSWCPQLRLLLVS
jgi:hypothetical protein